MNKNTYILGISESHNATAALVKDGKLIAACSEERLSRKKNHFGFPRRAINYVMKEGNIKGSDIDLVVSSFENHAMYSLYETDEISVKGINGRGKILQKLISKAVPVMRIVSYRIPVFHHLKNLLFNLYYPLTQKSMAQPRIDYIEKNIGVKKDRVHFANHHMCHIYASYALRTIKDCSKYLIMTLDGEGDDSCATVGILSEGSYKKISETPNYRSVGKLYQAVTEYLGMKPNEHEYKVMGLAPYSESKKSEEVCSLLKDLIWVDDDLIFHTKMDDQLFQFVIRERLYKYRFDYIAGGLQLFTERLVLEWVNTAVRKTGIPNVIFGGGVFMNVKLNKLISEIHEIKEISFCPSSGDESTAIGAAFFGYELVKNKTQNLSLPIEPVGNLYLGPAFSEKDFEECLRTEPYKNKFKIVKVGSIEKEVARLVNEGEIVAVMFGRMEFGARALGNRSILADPRNKEVIDRLNRTIKMRDFWMPFASSILEEQQAELIENPKRTYAPYMMLAFDTTAQGRKDIVAALHPADFTTRPQIVSKSWNEKYWNILNEFQKLPGVAGILNTSFNIHGEPIVCTPEDALHTLEFSDLKWLATDYFLINKIA